MSSATNSTLPCPTCSTEQPQTLSAGSAAFIVIALILGCMTQPPGSLISSNCNRFWRISPLHAFGEGENILIRLSGPVYNYLATVYRRLLPVGHMLHLGLHEHQGTYTVRIAAHALLAERLGNSRQYNLWQRQQGKVAAPTVEDMVALLDEVEKME
jgi:hypothetical protein